MASEAAQLKVSGSGALRVSLWVVQGLLAAAFLMTGLFKLLTPVDQLVAMGMTLPTALLRVAGTAEVLGAMGLLIPSVTRILPRLTPIAAALLGLVVTLAVAAHVAQGELKAVPPPLVLGLLSGFVAWGRFRAAPIAPRGSRP